MNQGVLRSRGRLLTTFLLLLAVVAPPASAALRKGDDLPTFSAQATDGRSYAREDVARASLSVIFFFSTTCKACLPAMQALQRQADRLKGQNVLVLAMSKQGADELKSYASEARLGFPVVRADEATMTKLGAGVLPTTLIVGPGPLIQRVFQGSDATVPTVLASIADTQLQRNDGAGARELYAAAAKSGDGSGTAQSGVGYSLLKEGKLADAEKTFQELAKHPEPKVAAKGETGLAETYLRQGQVDKAAKAADLAIKHSPEAAGARLAKSKVAYRQGDKAAAAGELELAARHESTADFSWEKAEVHTAQGNLHREKKQPKEALAAYAKATEESPYQADALSNQGVVLQETGHPEEAVKVFTELKQRNPADPLADGLLRQAQAALAQKQDLEKQKFVDGLVNDLMQQFEKNRGQKPAAGDDSWTSPPLALSILSFGTTSSGLLDRAGVDTLLQAELTQQLERAGVRVVDRAVLDKLLSELKLGASNLADPETALRLGRIMAARLIASGTLARSGSNASTVGLRLIDTETTEIVLPLSQKENEPLDPAQAAERMVKTIVATLHDKYPLKGRIALTDETRTIVNLGKKHGVAPGQVFNVLGEGKPIEINGKIIGYDETKLGQIEITEVQDGMSIAKPVAGGGTWSKNARVIQK